MLVALTTMHHRFAPDLPAEVRLFDPGLPPEGNPEPDTQPRLLPADLPLDPRTAARTVRDAVAFGSQFREARDMAYYRAGASEDFYTGSSMDIQSQLSTPQAPGAAVEAARRNAQLELLFACHLEARLLELAQAEQGVRESFARMDHVLGLNAEDAVDGDDPDPEAASLDLNSRMPAGQTLQQAPQTPEDPGLSWRRLGAAMLAFLPEDAAFFVPASAAAKVSEDLAELGLTPQPASGPDADGLACVTAPGQVLFGSGRPDPERPWLDRDVRVCLATA